MSVVMADDRAVWPNALTLVLLVPAAVLVTVLIWVVEVLVVLARYDFQGVGFAVTWEWRDTVMSVLAYALLLGVLLVRRTAHRSRRLDG